jgi:hypothetical protein
MVNCSIVQVFKDGIGFRADDSHWPDVFYVREAKFHGFLFMDDESFIKTI